MDDQKKRVRTAIENYVKKQDRVEQGPTRKNDKPEKEVEKACLKWMRSNGWNVSIYESKATYNPNSGRYVSAAMKAGTADCMGNLPDGIEVIVEFKAPGKLSTFAAIRNTRQYMFVQRKIVSNCFACVTDSVERLIEIFETWKFKKLAYGELTARNYLISMLPAAKPKKKAQGGLFD